ncbi:MAG: hypothetical protein A3J55_00110 [Candidatus Ryanbacteria bacterium RIFCSPHIGHO2_02_FULL_45_17b]|nr:MAG: hypothetical protein A3J55_00110 [Candidatus Ryanbacteria bacterium RIFCSPHIGHO2_02_FULL_45_17b]
MTFGGILNSYSLELFTAFLCGAIFIVLIAHMGSVAYRQKKEAAKKPRLSTEGEAEHILSNAHEEAVDIIRVATAKAREMLQSAARVKEGVSSSLATELTAIAEQHKQYLQDASLKYVETYEHMAERAQEEYLTTLHEASQAMAGDAKHTLDMFEIFLKEQTIGYKQQMEKKIDDLRNKVNEQVNEYKKEKLKRVDKAINEIVILVAKIVIGRSLNIQEHNELVLRALDEAKKEGFFGHLEL